MRKKKRRGRKSGNGGNCDAEIDKLETGDFPLSKGMSTGSMISKPEKLVSVAFCDDHAVKKKCLNDVDTPTNPEEPLGGKNNPVEEPTCDDRKHPVETEEGEADGRSVSSAGNAVSCCDIEKGKLVDSNIRQVWMLATFDAHGNGKVDEVDLFRSQVRSSITKLGLMISFDLFREESQLWARIEMHRSSEAARVAEFLDGSFVCWKYGRDTSIGESTSETKLQLNAWWASGGRSRIDRPTRGYSVDRRLASLVLIHLVFPGHDAGKSSQVDKVCIETLQQLVAPILYNCESSLTDNSLLVDEIVDSSMRRNDKCNDAEREPIPIERSNIRDKAVSSIRWRFEHCGDLRAIKLFGDRHCDGVSLNDKHMWAILQFERPSQAALACEDWKERGEVMSQPVNFLCVHHVPACFDELFLESIIDRLSSVSLLESRDGSESCCGEERLESPVREIDHSTVETEKNQQIVNDDPFFRSKKLETGSCGAENGTTSKSSCSVSDNCLKAIDPESKEEKTAFAEIDVVKKVAKSRQIARSGAEDLEGLIEENQRNPKPSREKRESEPSLSMEKESLSSRELDTRKRRTSSAQEAVPRDLLIRPRHLTENTATDAHETENRLVSPWLSSESPSTTPDAVLIKSNSVEQVQDLPVDRIYCEPEKNSNNNDISHAESNVLATTPTRMDKKNKMTQKEPPRTLMTPGMQRLRVTRENSEPKIESFANARNSRPLDGDHLVETFDGNGLVDEHSAASVNGPMAIPVPYYIPAGAQYYYPYPVSPIPMTTPVKQASHAYPQPASMMGSQNMVWPGHGWVTYHPNGFSSGADANLPNPLFQYMAHPGNDQNAQAINIRPAGELSYDAQQRPRSSQKKQVESDFVSTHTSPTTSASLVKSRLFVTFACPIPDDILRDAFSEAAPGLEYVSRSRDKTFVFVKYNREASARLAMQKLNGKELIEKCPLKISIAQPPKGTEASRKRQRTSDPGISDGMTAKPSPNS